MKEVEAEPEGAQESEDDVDKELEVVDGENEGKEDADDGEEHDDTS
jgi:hypothetical protein